MTAKQAIKKIQAMYPECDGIQVKQETWKYRIDRKDIEVSYSIWLGCLHKIFSGASIQVCFDQVKESKCP